VAPTKSRLQRKVDWRKSIGPSILILAIIYPFIDRWLGLGQLGKIEGMLILVILAMGLNIVVGYAGLLDLGYAAFFAIGAYTMAFLTSPSSYFIANGWVPDRLQNFWAAMAVSWMVAAIFGVILGAPTLRLRGDYLAIVTLGFGEIVPNIFLNATTVTNGTQGLNLIGQPPSFTIPFTNHVINFSATNQANWYWLMLGVVLFSLFLCLRFHDSRLGRSWVAVREDEIAASSMGVNLVRTKLWAFAMGASFAGFAGSVYSSAFQFVHPDQFAFSVSVMILAMVILGGIGNVYGVMLGAMLIGGFDRILAEELNRPLNWFGNTTGVEAVATHDVGTDRFLVFGLALVIMMLVRPEGLLPSKRRKMEFKDAMESQDGVV